MKDGMALLFKTLKSIVTVNYSMRRIIFVWVCRLKSFKNVKASNVKCRTCDKAFLYRSEVISFDLISLENERIRMHVLILLFSLKNLKWHFVGCTIDYESWD